MKKLFFILLILLLIIGCSSKIVELKLNKVEQKKIDNIDIVKNKNLLFYAYLKDGYILTRISSKKLIAKKKEEIIHIYKNGYFPDYDISQKRKACGYNVAGEPVEAKNIYFCKSNYTIASQVARDIFANTLVGFFSAGFSLVGVGNMHVKKFFPKLFKKAIIKSKLIEIKKVLKNKKIDTIIAIRLNPKDINSNKIILSNKFKNQDSFMVFDENEVFKGIVDFSDLKQKNIFEATSTLTQRLVNTYFKIKKPMDINLLIPPKIPKPKLPPIPKLIKSEFETQKMFNNRVKQARLKREEKIKTLQSIFRYQVEERNKKIDELKKLHQKDLAQIELEEKAKRENIEKYMPYFTSIAMKYLVGNLALKDLRYDAENQLMYANLKSSNPNYHKKIYLKVPLDKAQIFKSKENYTPIVTYEYNKDRLTLKEIKVDNYYAKLTQTDYQPKQIEVKLKDKEINTHYAQNDLYLQNPNLKDIVVSDSIIIEGEDKTIADFKDDIPQLLQSVNQTSQDPKKWLFVIGAEEYDNTDNVIYSKRSAEIFAKVAKKTLGIIERNSYLFIGGKATSGAIEDNLNRMLENVNEGDSIYFYYSGHGIPVLPDRNPYILPKDKIPDYISRSPFFKLNNIYNLLSNSKANKIIAVIDSCFSGSTDGKSIFKGVASVVLAPKRVTFNHNKMVVITAGRNRQFSNMYQKRGHRLFSYFMMKSLLEGKRAVSAVYNAVYPNVKEVSNGFGDLKRQEPTIEGNKKLSF